MLRRRRGHAGLMEPRGLMERLMRQQGRLHREIFGDSDDETMLATKYMQAMLYS